MSRPKAVHPLTDLLLTFAGPAIWFGHFAFIYGAETLICIEPAATGGERMFWIYALATVAALAGLGFRAATLVRDPRFLPRTALVLSLLAVAAMIWTAIPALLLPVCAS